MRIVAFIIVLVVIGYMAYTNAKEKVLSKYKRHNHEDK